MSTNSETAPLLPRSTAPPPPPPPRLLPVVIVVAATATALLCVALLDATTAPRSARRLQRTPLLSIAVLGDWGRDGRHKQNQVARSLADVHHSPLAPTHVISSGDNFYDIGVESVHDHKFNTSFEQVYHAPHTLHTPWYAILGNHDHLGNAHAQIAYSKRSNRWNMPAAYFTTHIDGVLAVFLDTTPFVNDKYGKSARKNGFQWREQVKWLDRTLRATHPSQKILVFGHHNMYTMSVAGHYGTHEVKKHIEPLLLRHSSQILAYISGHEHALMHMQPYGADGFDHILSGAGSKLDDIREANITQREHLRQCCSVLPVLERPDERGSTAWYAREHGFFLFRYDGSHIYLQAIDDEGNVLYTYQRSVLST